MFSSVGHQYIRLPSLVLIQLLCNFPSKTQGDIHGDNLDGESVSLVVRQLSIKTKINTNLPIAVLLK